MVDKCPLTCGTHGKWYGGPFFDRFGVVRWIFGTLAEFPHSFLILLSLSTTNHDSPPKYVSHWCKSTYSSSYYGGDIWVQCLKSRDGEQPQCWHEELESFASTPRNESRVSSTQSRRSTWLFLDLSHNRLSDLRCQITWQSTRPHEKMLNHTLIVS